MSYVDRRFAYARGLGIAPVGGLYRPGGAPAPPPTLPASGYWAQRGGGFRPGTNAVVPSGGGWRFFGSRTAAVNYMASGGKAIAPGGKAPFVRPEPPPYVPPLDDRFVPGKISDPLAPFGVKEDTGVPDPVPYPLPYPAMPVVPFGEGAKKWTYTPAIAPVRGLVRPPVDEPLEKYVTKPIERFLYRWYNKATGAIKDSFYVPDHTGNWILYNEAIEGGYLLADPKAVYEEPEMIWPGYEQDTGYVSPYGYQDTGYVSPGEFYPDISPDDAAADTFGGVSKTWLFVGAAALVGLFLMSRKGRK